MDRIGVITLITLVLLGCNGGSKGGVTVEPEIPILVNIVPEQTLEKLPQDPSIYLVPSGSVVQFHAVTFDGVRVDNYLVWATHQRLSSLDPLGTITQDGKFTAPATPSALYLGGGEKQGAPHPYMGSISVNVVVQAP